MFLLKLEMSTSPFPSSACNIYFDSNVVNVLTQRNGRPCLTSTALAYTSPPLAFGSGRYVINWIPNLNIIAKYVSLSIFKTQNYSCTEQFYSFLENIIHSFRCMHNFFKVMSTFLLPLFKALKSEMLLKQNILFLLSHECLR